MRLPTENGSLDVRGTAGRAVCGACGRTGEVMAEVGATTGGGSRATVVVCGTCLAGALAVRLGAIHFAETGELIDMEQSYGGSI